jgi:hypothetical protein
MSKQLIHIEFDREDAVYLPGEVLAFTCWTSDRLEVVRELEVTVRWHTEGKGTEDSDIVLCRRRTRDKLASQDGQRFEVRLPNSPLSYDGVLFQVRWCVHVLAIVSRDEEVEREATFWVGTVPAAQKVKL